MIKATAGQIYLNALLPPDLRDYERVIDKKGIRELLLQVANKHPDKYRDIAFGLMNLGRDVAHNTGSSISLKDLKSANAKQEIIGDIKNKIKKWQLDPNLTSEDLSNKTVDLLLDKLPDLRKKVHEEGLKENNAFSTQVISGSRGNTTQLNSLRGADLLVVDQKDKPIPVPILHSYSEGLDPVEYWAAGYGSRKGVYATKFATANAGFFSKQLNLAAHKLLTSDEEPLENTGLPVDTADMDNEGAALAKSYGPYEKNTILTPKILKELAVKYPRILIHSPISAIAKSGAVPRIAAGIREKGRLPDINENIGMTAAQALGEKLSQSQLCLAKGTLVKMADFTLKPIEEIRVGDYVLGADTKGNTFPSKVLNTYDNGIKKCYKYHFTRETIKGSKFIICTPDHKIVDWNNEIKAINDIKGVITAELFDDNNAALLYEPMALLLGLVLGDDCYTKSVNGVHFSCADLDLIKELEPYLNSLNLKLHKLKGHPYYYKFSLLKEDHNLDRDSITGRMLPGEYRNPIRRYLTKLGINEKYSYEKYLPDVVNTWNNKAISELLAGLFITDGSIYCSKNQIKPHISYGSTSLLLVEQIKALLENRFNIECSRVYTNNSGRNRPVYSISIPRSYSVIKFFDMIPMMGIKKQKITNFRARWGYTKEEYNYYTFNRKELVGDINTYDIEVDNKDHLFVLENCLLIKNSAKHGAGRVGGQTIAGFELINQLAQTPEHFKNGATHAQLDGRVSAIEEAPQGGKYVYINNIRHYISQDRAITVKPNSVVEAGDTLSDGIPNPNEYIKFNGIGEARRKMAYQLKKAFEDSNMRAHRRNTEILARGLIKHILIKDLNGPPGTLPGDTVEYDDFAANYTPRPGTQLLDVNKAQNKYLEKPTLHYSIGTRVTPSVIKELNNFDVKQVAVHEDEPIFEPVSVRALDTLASERDWMSQLGGFNLQRYLSEATHRGSDSNLHGKSYLPALAYGLEFGENEDIGY